MKGHPLHGSNPLVAAITQRCAWGEASGLYLFKLQRRDGARIIVHPTAGDHGRPTFTGTASNGEPSAATREHATAYPGWEVCFA